MMGSMSGRRSILATTEPVRFRLCIPFDFRSWCELLEPAECGQSRLESQSVARKQVELSIIARRKLTTHSRQLRCRNLSLTGNAANPGSTRPKGMTVNCESGPSDVPFSHCACRFPACSVHEDSRSRLESVQKGESRTGAVAVASRWPLARLALRRRIPVDLALFPVLILDGAYWRPAQLFQRPACLRQMFSALEPHGSSLAQLRICHR